MRQCHDCWITEDDGTGVKRCERCGRDWCEEHYFGHGEYHKSQPGPDVHPPLSDLDARLGEGGSKWLSPSR